MKSLKRLSILITGLVFVGGFFIVNLFVNRDTHDQTVYKKGLGQVTVYKSPSCGCCVGYTRFLKQDGYVVSIEETTDMNSVKQAHNIPSSMQSCHTAIIGDYFVEGHIPLEVVDKLLAEKPNLDGIALPGMPAGSPGMPGIKSEEFIIYGLKDGQVSEYTRI
ncbi:hypothetical protein IID21_01615 [Patescibacteria group bacterium]|nr:hypothetical protein [Patescibacteria group bacterium]